MQKVQGRLEIIKPEQTYSLRHQVLRPNQSLADCAYPLDHAPSSLHVGYLIQDQVVGVGSLFREDPSGAVDQASWRIRGMAVEPEHQGLGIGGSILQALISHAEEQTPVGEIWCNGRATVKGFYENAGFHQVGEVFDLPPIGPHVMMTRLLTGS